MKKIFKYIAGFFTDPLKRDSDLAERRARFEKVIGVKATQWYKGPEAAQNQQVPVN